MIKRQYLLVTFIESRYLELVNYARANVNLLSLARLASWEKTKYISLIIYPLVLYGN